MDIKQLRTLVTIAQTRSVTRASVLLNIVQPAVSRHLRLLEEDLGITLFDRSRNGMELTEAGKVLLEYARRALNEIDRARAEICQSKGSVGGIVTIGLLPSTCDLLASPLVTAVTRQYPGIHLRISIGYTGHLQRRLEAGEVDAALLYDLNSTPAIQVKPLLEEGLWVVGQKDSKLSPDAPISFTDLDTLPLILPSAPHGLRGLIEHEAALLGVQLNIIAETNSMSVQKILVVGGHGFTILPSIAVLDDIARGLVVAAPLTEPTLMRKIVIALPANRQTSTPTTCAVSLLLDCMRDAIQRGDWGSARWVGQ